MTDRPLLCARCSTADRHDAPGWGSVLLPGLVYTTGRDLGGGMVEAVESHDSVDVCPSCLLTILEFLRSTP
jgi:hypothetical protein